MTRRSRIKLFVAVAALPLLVFGLPVLAARWIGPERADALARSLGGPPAAAPQAHEHPAGRRVPAFSLVDQERRTVSDRDLRGHVWVASFFISQCAGSCPMTSSKMAELQRRISEGGVRLVSFSMNPEYDTPDVLKGYAGRFAADPGRWHMLTGERATIVGVVEGLGLAERQRQRADAMVHTDQFVLVDADGRVRGYYDSGDPPAMAHLAADAAQLAAATGRSGQTAAARDSSPAR